MQFPENTACPTRIHSDVKGLAYVFHFHFSIKEEVEAVYMNGT